MPSKHNVVKWKWEMQFNGEEKKGGKNMTTERNPLLEILLLVSVQF